MKHLQKFNLQKLHHQQRQQRRPHQNQNNQSYLCHSQSQVDYSIVNILNF